MSPISAPSKFLVTGANGFVAAWVIRALLEKGHAVRGTVRSVKKGDYLRNIFKTYGDKFELVIVEDITKEGAFDDAVKGIDIVAHTASPFQFKADDPDDFIAPAVNGTVGILESVKRHGLTVKRIIVLSSASTIVDPFNTAPVIIYDESDWNETSHQLVEQQGKNAPVPFWYIASKTLAEKAAWDFVEKNKSEINFDLVTLVPPYIFGPPIHEVHSVSELNQSLSDFHDTLVKGVPYNFPEIAHGFIDVRDLAEAHVRAAEVADAGGKRFIISGGSFHWQDIMDTAAEIQPPVVENLAKGTPGIGRPISKNFTLKAGRAEQILNMKWRPLQDTIRDTLVAFKEQGFA
ncbi:NAD-P-binding protein [Dentipellis sp. KUC8613]|nr:NAD-P-binding protein [Dentipellis sp. KUC8613]